MRKRIAKFLVAVPMTAGIIVNTNTNNANINKNLVPQNSQNSTSVTERISLEVTEKHNANKTAKIVLAASKKEKDPKIAVKEKPGNQSKINELSNNGDGKMTPEQLAVMEKMVAGYPIEQMLPFIAKRNPVTAAFLVAIAKKESNWGKRSPRSGNGDCFNYWGFKDHRFPFASGHSCFPSAETAIDAVGNRIDKLVSQGRDNPAELVIWKCGSACAQDGNKGKWISDVNLYFRPIVAASK